MNRVKYITEEDGNEAFVIEEDSARIGEMIVGIKDNQLTVYHTGVSEKWEGKGIARILLDAMAEHARTNSLKVIPLCTYVQAQFRKSPQQFADIV